MSNCVHYKYQLAHVSIASMQFLLGAFYYIEAAVLFEDFHDKLHPIEHGQIEGIEYFNSTEVTHAYQTAA